MICTICHREDPACGFYPRHSACKDCRRFRARLRYANLAADPAFLAAESARRQGRVRPPSPPKPDGRKRVPRPVRTKFISAEDYQALADRHAGRCAICGTTPDFLALDHDHVTGRIRGFLCTPCNLMLGHARDDIAVLTAAIAYLSRKD